MLRDITLGQYYQTDSVIHKLDPRVKLIATICFIISLFVVKSWVGYAIAAIFLAVSIKLSKVPFKYMIKGMRAIVFILLITVVFNLFLTPTDGHCTTLNSLAMGSSKAAPSSTTSGFRRTTRRSSEKQKEDTTLPAERGTPLPLFVQTLRLYSHRIHPTKETS